MKKVILLFFLILVLFSSYSCTKDKQTEEIVITRLQGIEENSEGLHLNAGFKETLASLNIKTSTNWIAETDSPFIIITPNEGKAGNSIVRVKVLENPEFDERQGQFVLKSFSQNVKHIINVVQSQKNYLNVTPSVLKVSGEGETISLDINSNIYYTFSFDVDWIKECTTKVMSNSKLEFQIEPNPEYNERKALITLLPENSPSYVVKIIQKKRENHDLNFEWVDIKAGNFIMGCDTGDEDEAPAHKVEIEKDFKISKYPVTFCQYDAFCDATGRVFKNDYGWGRGNHPIINVSRKEAKEFCKWANVRLATEPEWEYACRAGTTTTYYWGDEFDASYLWYMDNSNNESHLVGQKKPNAWGLYDMLGGVWEWCSGSGPGGGILRGGSWMGAKRDTRCSNRYFLEPSRSIYDCGFRVVSLE